MFNAKASYPVIVHRNEGDVSGLHQEAQLSVHLQLLSCRCVNCHFELPTHCTREKEMNNVYTLKLDTIAHLLPLKSIIPAKNIIQAVYSENLTFFCREVDVIDICDTRLLDIVVQVSRLEYGVLQGLSTRTQSVNTAPNIGLHTW